jgi:glycosyltransferase involved in cell wall biosynthesis
MKISIVTPTFNRSTYLDDTIRSVLTQRGNFDLEYVIQDGGSGEEVLRILDYWQQRVDRGDFDTECNSITFKYFVDEDDGMYDAINKGFDRTSGEIMAWINSDDMYHEYCFQSVCQVFEQFPDIHWLTGIPNTYNHMGSKTGFYAFPDAYSTTYIRHGYYDPRFFDYGFHWIQQESTFWRRDLWHTAGPLNTQYKYAGDFYLWREFAKHTDLVKLQSFLGGFRFHDDQMTVSLEHYRKELPELGPPPLALKQLKQWLAITPGVRQKYFSDKQEGAPLLKRIGLDFDDLFGRTVEWSHYGNKWILKRNPVI